LQSVYFIKNNISNVAKSTFNSLKKFDLLDMKQNSIEIVQLNDLTSLSKLTLGYNMIKKFQVKHFTI
jgi:Leucine-rich repeat (LRR) protein